MAVRIVSAGGAGAAASSSVDDGPRPDGKPYLQAIDDIQIPNWTITRDGHGGELDTLFVTTAEDEPSVLAEGGMLNGNPLNTFNRAAVRATLSAGRLRSLAKAVTSEGTLSFPITGRLALDEFLITWTIDPDAAGDLQTNSTGTLWRINSSHQAVRVYMSAAGVLSATITCDESAWTPAGSANTIQADMTLVSGEVPAGTETPMALAWDKATGRLTLYVLKATDGLVRSAQSSASINPAWLDRPWSGDPWCAGALIVGHGSLTGTGFGGFKGWKVSPPVVHRYARLHDAGKAFKPAPGITVDASTAQGAWRERLAGLVGHYSGWARNEADEVAFAAIRDAQCQLIADAGCKAVRLAESHERTAVTLNAASPPGSVTSIDTTDVVAHWRRFLDRGINKIHWHVGFTPTAFNGGSPGNTPPNLAGFTEAQAFALYATYFSALVTDLKARLTAAGYTLSTVLQSLSFWNEPASSGFWNGTQAQLFDLWQAVAQKLATDHTDIPKLGGVDERFVSASTGAVETIQRGVIARAASITHAYPMSFLHSYVDGSLTRMNERVDEMRSYLDDQGFTGAGITISEWGDISSAYNGGDDGYHVIVRDQRWQNEHMAAYVHAYLALAYELGVLQGHFFRIGQPMSDTQEIWMGTMSNDNPTRVWPVFGTFSLLWKHSGNRVSATSNWPGVSVLASKSASNVITVTYGRYSVGDRNRNLPVQFAFTGLPAVFTWKQWAVTKANRKDGRPTLVAKGDQTNLPTAVDLDGLSVGCLQVTP